MGSNILKRVVLSLIVLIVALVGGYFVVSYGKDTNVVPSVPERKIIVGDMKANMLSYHGADLYYENVNLNDVAKNNKTPIWLCSKAKILENCKGYNDAFKNNMLNDYKVHFAMKANSNLSILKLALQQNLGIDAVSIGEIQKAKMAGFEYKDIVFSGVGKTKDDLTFVIKNEIGQINIESFEEIQMLIDITNELKKTANVAIRINPDIKAHTHEKISTGKKVNKFGIDAKKLDQAIDLIKTCEYLNLNGLSIHIGSQLTQLGDFEKAFSFVKAIYDKHPEFKTVDLGGGLGINYNNEEIISKNDYVKLIAKYFADFKGKIMIEPGRSIVGDACIFMTKIVRVKRTDSANFIIVDGGMNNLVRPAMYGAWHQPMLTKRAIDKNVDSKNNVVKKYDIVGPICESGDTFCKNVSISDDIIEDDNCVVFMYAGAYGKSMSSNYNLHDIAMELMVDGDKVMQISKQIGWNDLVKFELNTSANE